MAEWLSWRVWPERTEAKTATAAGNNNYSRIGSNNNATWRNFSAPRKGKGIFSFPYFWVISYDLSPVVNDSAPSPDRVTLQLTRDADGWITAASAWFSVGSASSKTAREAVTNWPPPPPHVRPHARIGDGNGTASRCGNGALRETRDRGPKFGELLRFSWNFLLPEISSNAFRFSHNF